jgi:O-antigen/teichoic acid export membrane protein
MGTAAAELSQERAHSRVLSGSIIMLLSTVVVSCINFIFNAAMARMLGPARFAQVAVANTILMLVSAISLAFQMVCAKFVARNETRGQKTAIYRPLLTKAWVISLAVGFALTLTQKPVAAYLHMPDSWVLAVLAIGLAAYVPLGVHRGAMQGNCDFKKLSGSYISEALAKLVFGLFLVAAGYEVLGAIGAISASVLIAYLVPPLPADFKVRPETASEPASFGEGMQAIVFFVGQVIINNIDILLVKHFFPPALAGLYAVVAMMGRVLYLACWQVVSAMFPVSAAAKPREEDPNVVLVPLVFVLVIAVVFMLVVSFFPALIIHLIFGAGFHEAEPLLTLYAAATGLYALSAVLMAYEMSRRIANTGWLQLMFSGILVLAIGAFHSSLREVIVVQIVLRAVMLVLVTYPFLRRYRSFLLAQESV